MITGGGEMEQSSRFQDKRKYYGVQIEFDFELSLFGSGYFNTSRTNTPRPYLATTRTRIPISMMQMYRFYWVDPLQALNCVP